MTKLVIWHIFNNVCWDRCWQGQHTGRFTRAHNDPDDSGAGWVRLAGGSTSKAYTYTHNKCVSHLLNIFIPFVLVATKPIVAAVSLFVISLFTPTPHHSLPWNYITLSACNTNSDVPYFWHRQIVMFYISLCDIKVNLPSKMFLLLWSKELLFNYFVFRNYIYNLKVCFTTVHARLEHAPYGY